MTAWRERVAVALLAVVSLLTLWVGSGVVEAAVVAEASRPVAAPGTLLTQETADYGMVFAYSVAPVRGELAKIRRVVIDFRDALPLPWGMGYA